MAKEMNASSEDARSRAFTGWSQVDFLVYFIIRI